MVVGAVGGAVGSRRVSNGGELGRPLGAVIGAGAGRSVFLLELQRCVVLVFGAGQEAALVVGQHSAAVLVFL